MIKCAKCKTDTPKQSITWGKAKKVYGGGICSTCVKAGALR